MAKWVDAIPSGNKSKRRGKLLCVAAYCRVSTAFEEQMGSLEAQQQFYTSMIDMRPDWGNAGIFSDHATGLNTAKRPGLNAMLRLCRRGKIDLILTKSFSRFGRNTLDMLKTIWIPIERVGAENRARGGRGGPVYLLLRSMRAGTAGHCP